MKIQSKSVHQQKAVELRSQAQELKDAAGGEKASAASAKKTAAVHQDTWVKANAAAGELLNEAKALRAEAASKLKEAVGGRGLHALENVARGFGRLMSALSGQRVDTTVTLKQDPEAKAAYERLSALADSKEKASVEQRNIAFNAHAQATAALAKMEGHEQTAANHMAMAGKLLGEAKGHDRAAAFAGAAEHAATEVKSFFKEVGNELKGAATEGFKAFEADARVAGKMVWQDLKGALKELLLAGANALTKAAQNLDDKTAAKTDAQEPAAARQDVAQKADAVAEKARVIIVDSKGTAYLPEDADKAQAQQAAPAKEMITEYFDFPSKAQARHRSAQPSPIFNVKPGGGQLRPDSPIARRIELGLDLKSQTNADIYNALSNILKTHHDTKRSVMRNLEADLVKNPGAPVAEKAAAPSRGPRIDEPPKGEKKVSESLLAARWAAEAVGIDWTKLGTGELKKALEAHHNTLGIKHSSSPFEVKAHIMRRLGMPEGKGRENVKSLDIEELRAEIAKREALGLSRLAPKADVEKAQAKLGGG